MTLYSDILKELRHDKGLTQADIAKHFGISQTMYSMYESGRRTMKIEMLCELADILETSTDYILGRTAQQKPYPKR
ncbi:MAG TPA: transcriptional regulator [Ruminococcaceae bacterium]|nr:transcriptional regulator [Oscillospiraceae bacterium]